MSATQRKEKVCEYWRNNLYSF